MLMNREVTHPPTHPPTILDPLLLFSTQPLASSSSFKPPPPPPPNPTHPPTHPPTQLMTLPRDVAAWPPAEGYKAKEACVVGEGCVFGEQVRPSHPPTHGSQ